MQKSNFIITLGFLIILLSAGYVGVTFYQQQTPPEKYFASIAPLIRQIMVVDMSQRGIFTEQAVLTGQLPILSIHMGMESTQHNQDKLNFLDSIGRLLIFDPNNDNRIDIMDPIFSHLELAYINQQQITHVLIADAGIRAIYLDKGNLTPTELFPNGPKGYWNVANTAILADGSKRVIRVMPINASSLPNPVVTDEACFYHSRVNNPATSYCRTEKFA